MHRILMTVCLALFLTSLTAAQQCAIAAKEIKPDLSPDTRKTYEEKLAAAFEEDERAGHSADSTIWLGRRIGYIGNYKDAIRVYTAAIKRFPSDARLYRHRGHRLITLRCFDDAIKDLETAAKLVKGKPDEVEPDGLPNAKNIPTSTLQTNIWYHLGLAYYLKGDLKKAIAAYRECLKLSKNNDMLAATSHWLYMALRRSEEYKEAEKILMPIDGEFEVIENEDYLKLLRLYREEVPPGMIVKMIGEEVNTLGNASLGYGLANWYLYNGDRSRALQIFRKIVAGDQWASFGFIAAEADLARLADKAN